jgi:hypothetical protein
VSEEKQGEIQDVVTALWMDGSLELSIGWTQTIGTSGFGMQYCKIIDGLAIRLYA